MAALIKDPLTRLAFSIYENQGVYALLIGSGLSRAAEIPTGWEITLDLIRRVAMIQGEDDQADWVSWYREATDKDRPQTISALDPVLKRRMETRHDRRRTGRYDARRVRTRDGLALQPQKLI